MHKNTIYFFFKHYMAITLLNVALYRNDPQVYITLADLLGLYL